MSSAERGFRDKRLVKASLEGARRVMFWAVERVWNRSGTSWRRLVSVLSVALFCARISVRDWAEAYAASARGSRYVRYIWTNNNTRLQKRVQEPERLNEMSRNMSAQYGVRLSKHSEREDC